MDVHSDIIPMRTEYNEIYKFANEDKEVPHHKQPL